MKIMSRQAIHAARRGDDYDTTCSLNGEINIAVEINEYLSIVYQLIPIQCMYIYLYTRRTNNITFYRAKAPIMYSAHGSIADVWCPYYRQNFVTADQSPVKNFQ